MDIKCAGGSAIPATDRMEIHPHVQMKLSGRGHQSSKFEVDTRGRQFGWCLASSGAAARLRWGSQLATKLHQGTHNPKAQRIRNLAGGQSLHSLDARRSRRRCRRRSRMFATFMLSKQLLECRRRGLRLRQQDSASSTLDGLQATVSADKGCMEYMLWWFEVSCRMSH